MTPGHTLGSAAPMPLGIATSSPRKETPRLIVWHGTRRHLTDPGRHPIRRCEAQEPPSI